MPQYDLIIIGGGLIGLASAYDYLQRHPGKRLLLLEKERSVGLHQSGRNSGVLHSGIYYKPGSLRAELCAVGKAQMQAFCEREAIPYEICGKVIVALEPRELPALERIYARGQANGVTCELIEQAQLREIEPHTEGIRAIRVPEAGIADYPAVARRLAQLIAERGGEVKLNAEVTHIIELDYEVVIESTAGAFSAETLISCAGLHADRVAAMNKSKLPDMQIVPFRGEYYVLKPEAEYLCNGLIYPVPDDRFPFLGVHFTRLVGGGVDCGPNAVLAFAREGYNKTDVNLSDLGEALRYRGFQKLALKYWQTGAGEMWRSINKAAFVKALQRLIPAIQAEHLKPAPAGVRATALTSTGAMFDDFAWVESKRVVHVINAPSPAATASLAIGRTIIDKVAALV